MIFAFGAWVAGFLISMVPAYVLLRFAGKQGRKPEAAQTLRLFAILIAGFLAFAGWLGSGGKVNPGALAAVAAVIYWAWSQSRRHSPPPK